MEGETTETRETRAGAGGRVVEPGREPLPCCVLQTVERDGRQVTICVATCCDATQAARDLAG
jgi:hypothetical protein